MSAQEPCPPDHPLMIAWNAYKATEEYKNSKKWASTARVTDHGDGSMSLTYPHTDGSLWAAFAAGFNASSLPSATRVPSRRESIQAVVRKGNHSGEGYRSIEVEVFNFEVGEKVEVMVTSTDSLGETK